MEQFAAIDFETANAKRSSVCSVGIVIVEEGKIIDNLYSLIRPRPNFYTQWTTAVHGLCARDTDKADDFPAVWADIAPQIHGLPLVAHNSPFDEGCLKAVFDLYGMDYPNYQFFCTCRLARRMYPTLVNHQLHTVSAHCGYNLANHHHALADAEACARIAIAMMHQKEVKRLRDLK
ncbi:MAG: 3'-5' exonuclease [Tannerellaceae bacterium]